LRVLIYDATSKQGEGLLRSAWASGARLYRALGRVDAYHGATSWGDALTWLARYRLGEPINEIQYWGHGQWGKVLIANDVLSERSLDLTDPLHEALDAVRLRFLPNGESLIWFRTCETLGAHAGQAFARHLSSDLGVRVAGHTYVIGGLQSGLHGLRPNELPRWSAHEGIAEGTPEKPIRALGSSPEAPHTVHFMNGQFDPSWFDC
jgi:hypothetical protein